MKLIKLSLLALLAVFVFSSCKEDPLTNQLREKLLGKTWAIESMTLRIEGDTVVGMTYSDLDEILAFSYQTNGNIYRRDSFENIFEEWIFREEKAFTGEEKLRQFCLPFQIDSTCTLLNPERNEMVFAAWYPLESANPGQFMGFSMALPKIFNLVEDVDGNAGIWAALYVYFRGEITWINDKLFVLENMSDDPAFPKKEYTFNIRVRQIEDSRCPDPGHCIDWGSKIDDCENGRYSWASCQCDCDEGWTGDLCSEQISAGLDCDTSSLPCVNGTIQANEDSSACECRCYPGYEGPACAQTKMKAVSTLAGNGSPGNINGSTPTFSEPRGMVTDHQGNIYLADAANNVIRKISPNGSASTIAGTGVAGYLDGPADQAMFHNPSGIARDPQGNLYVADHFNHVIRMIAPDGTVSTIAGTGNPGATNGDLLSASFSNPFAIVWDEYQLLGSQVLLVADRSSHLIRKVDLLADSVTIFAGTFVPGGGYINGNAENSAFNEITGLSLSSEGFLFVADRNNHAIRLVSIVNGLADQVTTFGGARPNGQILGIPANDPYLYPSAVQWQFPNLVYVADGNNHRIRLLVDSGFGFGTGSNVAGSDQNQSGFTDGTGTEARFSTPIGLCLDYNNVLFVSEQGNHAIRKLE